MLIPRDQIVLTNLEDEIKNSYLDYSMSVIVSRALPDVRDGMKPVHRRILFAMDDLGLLPNRPHKKSARLVGEVLGKYHPHGDSSVYFAMARMAQFWSMRYMLVDGQGNYGSMDGDSPAAMRYTETRLQWIATELLKDIDKDTVDFRPNFDDTLQEPTVLPAAIPNLLINGSSGIAVGMATNIPPHNLNDIVNAITLIIENPEVDDETLLKAVPGPDFPTGGTIYGYNGIKDMYLTGRGKMQVRANFTIEEKPNGKSVIIYNEMPYQVNKAALISKIAELVRNKVLEDIADVRDESGREGVRVVVETKRDAIASVVVNNLFKHTELQVTFGAIMLALVDNQPKVLTLREMLTHFLEHRNIVIIRRSQFELDAAEKRAHILEGFLIALDHIDEVIKTIKESADPKEASIKLQEQFGLSEIQAKAILEMRLQRLTGLEREKIQQEYREIIQTIEKLKAILASKELQMQIIKDELFEIAKKYGDKRRTQIEYDMKEMTIEDIVANEEMIVTITHNGFIKRTPVSSYRRQLKGGRGASGAGTHEDDFIEHIFKTSTHNNLLFFTDKGRCYQVKVYDLPEGSRQAKGRSLANVIAKESDEKVTAYLTIKDYEENLSIFMCTKKGTVKKTLLTRFSNVRSSGIIAISLDDDDKLISARVTDGSNEIIICTRNGIACHFYEKDVRVMGRVAGGVRGISLEKADYVVSMIINKHPDAQVLVVGEKGYGKRTPFEDFRLTKRGAKGVKSMNVTKKTGKVISMLSVLDEEDLVVITHKGTLIRMTIHDIRLIGRNTQGVRLIKLDDEDLIADITLVTHEEPVEDMELDEENGNGNGNDNGNDKLF